MAKRKDRSGRSIFAFKGNLEDMREIEEEVSELRAKLESGGSKKKINRQIAELERDSRRAFLKIFTGGSVAVGGTALATMLGIKLSTDDKELDFLQPKPSKPSKKALESELLRSAKEHAIQNVTPIQPVKLKSTEQVGRMMEFQAHWKKVSLDALSLFKDADPEVPKLIQFMQENAWYSIPKGPVVTQHIAKSMDELEKNLNNPKRFKGVFMPEKFAKHMRSSIVIKGRTIRIATSFRCKEWLGIMLTHEMSHIKDLLEEGENPLDRNQWLAGEVEAHLLEMKLLRHWNPNTYDFLITEGIPLFRQGEKEALALVRLAQSLYPLGPDTVSRNESYLGTASCILAVAFEEARNRGLSDKDLQAVYQRTAKEYR